MTTAKIIKPSEQTLKPRNVLFKVYGIGFSVILLLVLLTIVGFFVKYWFDHNQIKMQSPIVLRTPIWVEPVESPELTKVREEFEAIQTKLMQMEASEAARPKDAAIVNKIMKQSDASVIKNTRHPIIIWLVYGLESTWGKADICKSNNRGFNGFGFGQPDSSIADGTYKCYDTFESVVLAVDEWFDKQLKTKSLAESLCAYNVGPNSKRFSACMAMDPSTPYLRNFVAQASKGV